MKYREFFPYEWFPQRRFDLDFPLAFWFAGLWLYLKSFLYLCYIYMLGLEPPPYSAAADFEIAYFAVTMIPALLLGLALWNEKKQAVMPAILFFLVDTPVLLYHLMRLAEEGFLDSGLTRVLEFGSIALNVVALGWLFGNRSIDKTRSSTKR
jgi:hypothetical protein